MLDKNILYYGRCDPLPDRMQLRAGPLSMIYEAGDLRYVKLENKEILRGVYVSIRNKSRDTILPRIVNLETTIGEDSFTITYEAVNQKDELNFYWRGRISGNSRGTIDFSMEGVARSTFLRRRIGFCILHPIRECAGKPCIVEKADGTLQEGVFSAEISPYQLFLDMRAISHEVIPGVHAEVRFSGDIFEMEDQRNWTDTSYKTYCTPQKRSHPVEIKKGEKILQSVRLNLHGEVPDQLLPVGPGTDRSRLTFSLDWHPCGKLPRIGLGSASHGKMLSRREVSRLKFLDLKHLRVDLDLSNPEYEKRLLQTTSEAMALGLQIEAAIHLSDNGVSELSSLSEVLKHEKPMPIGTWLVFHLSEGTTSGKWINLARKHLAPLNPEARFGGGTNIYFTNINRIHPETESCDLISYSLNPQVHAFDNASLVESLETQAATAVCARRIAAGLPIAVSPVTLKPRFKPDRQDEETETQTGELPPQVDARQMSLFGAAWTVGSLKYLSESCVYSITYFETTGWRGVMEKEDGSPLPEKFRSLPGAVFPLYHVLYDVGEFRDGEILAGKSSDPLRVDGLSLCKNGNIRLILANLTGEVQHMTVNKFGRQATVRFLDETNVEEAMQAPEMFHSHYERSLEARNGMLELEMKPYSIVRVDGKLNRSLSQLRE